MEIGTQIELEITGISHQGYGIGRIDNLVVFVPSAMLGEVVLAEVTEYKKKMVTAQLLSVVSPSADRIAPQCVQSERCGGCELQHCNAEYQLKAKRQIVQDAITRLGRVDIEVEPVLGMEYPWQYRNKGIFHADYSTGSVQLGFYEQGSHTFVPAGNCMLFSNAVNGLVTTLEQLIQNSGKANYINKVMIRESRLNGALMVVFVTEDTAWRLPDLAKAVAEYPQVVSVYHNHNSNPKLMLGRKFNLLYGQETIEDTI